MTISHPAFELRIALKVAARAAYLDGATESQIETIVALARGLNEYNVGNNGRLTCEQADNIITAMYEAGAIPERRKSKEEIEAERELAAHAAATAAAKKIAKTQKKEEKAAREEAKRTIEGRRVAHVKFGEGTVIGEDQKTCTVMFDSQKKSLRVGREFLSEF